MVRNVSRSRTSASQPQYGGHHSPVCTGVIQRLCLRTWSGSRLPSSGSSSRNPPSERAALPRSVSSSGSSSYLSRCLPFLKVDDEVTTPRTTACIVRMLLLPEPVPLLPRLALL